MPFFCSYKCAPEAVLQEGLQWSYAFDLSSTLHINTVSEKDISTPPERQWNEWTWNNDVYGIKRSKAR